MKITKSTLAETEHGQEYSCHDRLIQMLMKNRKILNLVCIALLFLTGCAKDKGNYSYTEINEIKIVDANGLDFNNKAYGYRYGQQVRFVPQVTGTLSGADHSHLEFRWVKGQDTIGRDLALSIASEKLGVGNYLVVLHVLDKETTLTYVKQIFVYVMATITNGSYLLTANDAGETTLALLGPKAGDTFQYHREIGGIKLGDHPLNVQITSTPQWSINIATSGGDYPIAAFDLYTYLPLTKYPVNSSVVSGESLHPTTAEFFSRYFQTIGFIVMDGKCRFITQGKVGDIINADDPLDYDFGQNSILVREASEFNFIGGFDQKNQRLRIFGNVIGLGGSRFNDGSFDPEDTKGHAFVAAADMGLPTAGRWPWHFLTHKGDEYALHVVLVQSGSSPVQSQVTVKKKIPELLGARNFVFHQRYWYFSKGREIYRCSPETLEISFVMRLPSDGSGDIVAWNFADVISPESSRMGIATFNPASSAPKKGSYYLYDISTDKFEHQKLNAIDKAVSIEIL